jgi:hypothetical protein
VAASRSEPETDRDVSIKTDLEKWMKTTVLGGSVPPVRGTWQVQVAGDRSSWERV